VNLFLFSSFSEEDDTKPKLQKDEKGKKGTSLSKKKSGQAVEGKEDSNSEDDNEADDAVKDSDKDSEEDDDSDESSEGVRSGDEAVADNIKAKLKDLSVDYARGEGALMSDSSSDELTEDEEGL